MLCTEQGGWLKPFTHGKLNYSLLAMSVLKLAAYLLMDVWQFNSFAVLGYLQFWFTIRTACDTPISDLLLIERLQNCDDYKLQRVGISMMQRHSWYLVPEQAYFILRFCICWMEIAVGCNHAVWGRLSCYEASANNCVRFLCFKNPVWYHWIGLYLFEMVSRVMVWNVRCVNDSAEHGVALIQ